MTIKLSEALRRSRRPDRPPEIARGDAMAAFANVIRNRQSV